MRLATGLGLAPVALWTDDVVIVDQESFADETDITYVARETAAVPVASFERHVTGSFSAETCPVSQSINSQSQYLSYFSGGIM